MSSFSQEVTSLEKLLQNIENWKERGTPCFHPFKRDTGSLNLVCPRKWPNHRKRAHWQLSLYVKRVLPAEVENISLLGFRVAFVAQQRSGSVQIYFNLHPDIILIPLKENQLSSKWTKTPLLDVIWGVHRGWIRSNLKLENLISVLSKTLPLAEQRVKYNPITHSISINIPPGEKKTCNISKIFHIDIINIIGIAF